MEFAMNVIFSDTYTGTPGSAVSAAGAGLTLNTSDIGYTIASSGIADGGTGYSYPPFTPYPGLVV